MGGYSIRDASWRFGIAIDVEDVTRAMGPHDYPFHGNACSKNDIIKEYTLKIIFFYAMLRSL